MVRLGLELGVAGWKAQTKSTELWRYPFHNCVLWIGQMLAQAVITVYILFQSVRGIKSITKVNYGRCPWLRQAQVKTDDLARRFVYWTLLALLGQIFCLLTRRPT